MRDLRGYYSYGNTAAENACGNFILQVAAEPGGTRIQEGCRDLIQTMILFDPPDRGWPHQVHLRGNQPVVNQMMVTSRPIRRCARPTSLHVYTVGYTVRKINK